MLGAGLMETEYVQVQKRATALDASSLPSPLSARHTSLMGHTFLQGTRMPSYPERTCAAQHPSQQHEAEGVYAIHMDDSNQQELQVICRDSTDPSSGI